jgi:branched-chain amino acid transport system permease protein
MVDYTIYVLAPQVMHGLVWGMVIALIALGLTIIFGMLDVVNFAHGELYMLGAFFGYVVFSLTNNFWIALCVSVVAVSLLGVIIELVLIKPLFGRDTLFYLLLTFGLGMTLREIARLIWGGLARSIPVPVDGAVEILGTVYPTYRLMIFVFAVIIVLGVIFLFNKTELGAMIRASAHDHDMASALGIHVGKIYTMVFALGAGLAALAGMLMSPIMFVYPYMGVDAILRAFIVVIVGGMGSVFGVVLAALIIGQVESLFSLWISPTWAEILVFAALILSMVFKPGGLFGKTGEREG